MFSIFSMPLRIVLLISPLSLATVHAAGLDGATTTSAVAILEHIEALHGEFETLEVEFDQTRVSVMFEDETQAKGHLWIQRPTRLRCDYEVPDNDSTILFVDDTMYQYVPSIQQVDKVVYDSPEAAQEQFRQMLLAFGVSSEEVRSNYAVGPAEPFEYSKEKHLPGVVLTPLIDEVAGAYESFSVWFDPETWFPARVRFVELAEGQAGDVTTVRVRRVAKDEEVPSDIFEPNFPDGVEIIEH